MIYFNVYLFFFLRIIRKQKHINNYNNYIVIQFSQTQTIHKLTSPSVNAAYGQTNTIFKASPTPP